MFISLQVVIINSQINFCDISKHIVFLILVDVALNQLKHLVNLLKYIIPFVL
jgi:hypothetical protein